MNTPSNIVYSTSTAQANMRRSGKVGMLRVANAPKVSSSHNEYVGEGYSVRIQHCEHRDENGQVCDKYLGVNYPDNFCDEHRNEN